MVDLNRRIILSLQDGMVGPSVVIICSESWIFCLLICTFLSLFHSSTATSFGSFFILSLRLTIFLLYRSLLQSKTLLQKAFSLDAGVTKGVTSLAAHRGTWHVAGATTFWLHSPSWSKSFASIQKRLNSTEVFYLDEKRNAQRWQSNTKWRHKKTNPDDWKVRYEYRWLLVNWICLCFSLFLFSGTLNLIVVDSSLKIKEFLDKRSISFSESNRCTE